MSDIAASTRYPRLDDPGAHVIEITGTSQDPVSATVTFRDGWASGT